MLQSHKRSICTNINCFIAGQKGRRNSTNEEGGQSENAVMLNCLICGRTFTTQGSLRKHLSSHSPREDHQVGSNSQPGSNRRYACATCGKQFNRHSNMLRHADIHRQQPGDDEQIGYTCAICGCHYNFISSLTRHIVNKHMYTVGESEVEDGPQEPFELVEIDDSI